MSVDSFTTCDRIDAEFHCHVGLLLSRRGAFRCVQRRNRIVRCRACRLTAAYPGGETFGLPLQRVQKYLLAIRRPQEPAVLRCTCAECFHAANIAERIALSE